MMSRRRSQRIVPLVVVALIQLAGLRGRAAAAVDPIAKCKSTIATAASAFLKADQNALRKCREAIVKGKLPGGTSCTTEPKTAAAVERARRKISSAIAKACGGRDKTCGTADDETLAAIGWDIGACPGFFYGAYLTLPDPFPIRRPIIPCRGTIATCADVATCVSCLASTAVSQVTNLAYGQLKATDPKTQKALRKCQLTIGKRSLEFLGVQSAALAKCWEAVAKGKGTAPCPAPGDGKAAATIAAAALEKSTAICKACGGGDKSCGGGDDETRATIGFATSCPKLGTCGDTITTLGDVTGCLECITNRHEECADKGARPGTVAYPNACGHAPTPVPVPTATPTAELDYSASPIYGVANLAGNFSPDPYSVGMTVGGPVNVAYLGSSCSGFATTAPSLRVSSSGSPSLLRFYFVAANGDATMIVNDPYGNFYCVDDSFGTVNPTIDFNNPAGGSYDIWIGSYAANTTVTGTLYVTKNFGNHP